MKKQSFLRLKQSEYLRNMCSETEFGVAQLIQPMFVVEGLKEKQAIPGLRDNFRHTVESALKQIEIDLETGVRQFLFFFVPEKMSAVSLNFEFQNLAMRKISGTYKGSATFWADTCLCSSIDTGHCCVFHSNGQIELESTLKHLSGMAVEFAQAGADGIAPSDMMDGRTAAIRDALDENGYDHTCLMSYSTKFASSMYGPFRGAADSSPSFGDRKAYQLDIRDKSSALSASIRCADEGADLLMVKPGLTSIDLINPIREMTGRQVGAYQVSGEYTSLDLLAQQGFGDFYSLLGETWQVFRRAGASFIITYSAREHSKVLAR